MFGVIWPQGFMTEGNPWVTYGCTQGDIAATLTTDFHNGMWANYVPASPCPVCQIESRVIYKNGFSGPLHGVEFKLTLYMNRCSALVSDTGRQTTLVVYMHALLDHIQFSLQ